MNKEIREIMKALYELIIANQGLKVFSGKGKKEVSFDGQLMTLKKAKKSFKAKFEITRLNRGQIRYIENAIKIHLYRNVLKKLMEEEKQKILAQKTQYRYKKYLEEALKKIRQLIGNANLYRTSQSVWAGGNNYLIVGFEIATCGYSEQVWSRNRKWRGNNSYQKFGVQKGWIHKVYEQGIAFAGGMLTTHAVKIRENVWEADWVVQGRGFGLNVQKGVIKKVGDSYIHAKDEASADRIAKKRIELEILEAKKTKISAWLRNATVEEIKIKFANIYIKKEDSIKAGNCETGTQNWIDLHFPNLEKVKISDALTKDKGNTYLLKAIKFVILKDGHI